MPAPDPLDMSQADGLPYQVVDVSAVEGEEQVVWLNRRFTYAFKHLGKQADGSASTEGDEVVLMDAADEIDAGDAAGKKALIQFGGSPIIIKGSNAESLDSVPHAVQLAATGHSAKVQIFAYSG